MGLVILFWATSIALVFAENSSKPLDRLVNTHELRDVENHEVEILYLATRGIIKGYPDKTVKSEKGINRAEAVALFARLFDLDPVYDPTCSFSDVRPNLWYAGYVSALCKAGLISGYPDGTFKGDQPINRAEALKILLLGLGVDLETDYVHLPTDVYPNLWYAPYADYATRRILLTLTNATEFQGDRFYTRGDLFTNIYRIKRLQELEEEIYSPSLDPRVVSEDAPQEEANEEQKFGTPDLTIKSIANGGSGFTANYLDIALCNQGESAFFEVLTLKVNETFEKTLSNLTLSANACYSTGYYAKEGDKIDLFDVFPDGYSIPVTISATIDPHNEIAESNEQNNSLSNTIQPTSCGNNICEIGESQGVCPMDCEIPCESEFCNEKVVVFCGCDGREHLLRECTFNQPCMVDQCGEQVELFDEILEAQTKVYDCLADYFRFTPPRVPYVIYAEKTDPCNVPGGCHRPFTNRYTTQRYIMSPSVPGYVSYGETFPSRLEQLIIDEHEMTHHFLTYMLHSFPEWFNEGVAIQTDARVDCDISAHPLPSSIGAQITAKSGKNEVDIEQHLGARIPSLNPAIDTYTVAGFCLNDDCSLTFSEGFYRALKAGKVKISKQITPKMYDSFGRLDAHFIGALFMMGLKLDYRCTENCVRDIVVKLKAFEEARCPGPECGISLMMGARPGEEGITAAIIKEKTNEVTGKDTAPLFELLELK